MGGMTKKELEALIQYINAAIEYEIDYNQADEDGYVGTFADSSARDAALENLTAVVGLADD